MKYPKNKRVARNPFLFLFFKARLKWEVGRYYGKVNKLTVSRYFLDKKPVDLAIKPKPLSQTQEAEILSAASYFVREIYEKVEDLEYSQEMLDLLISNLTLWDAERGNDKQYPRKTWSEVEREYHDDKDYVDAYKLIAEYNKYSKIPKEHKDTLNERVLHRVVEFRFMEKLYLNEVGVRYRNVIYSNPGAVLRFYESEDYEKVLALLETRNKSSLIDIILRAHENPNGKTIVHCNYYRQIDAIITVLSLNESAFKHVVEGSMALTGIEMNDTMPFTFNYQNSKDPVNRIFIAISNFIYADDMVKNLVMEWLLALIHTPFLEIVNRPIAWFANFEKSDVSKLGFVYHENMLHNQLLYIADSVTFTKMHKRFFKKYHGRW